MQRMIKAEGRGQKAEVFLLHLCLLLSAFCLPAKADCTAVSTLSCGTTASSLTASDCTASDNSQYRLWQFSGTSGDNVTIEMHSTAFDTYLMLLDPNGVPLAENDDWARGVTDSKITMTLTTTGTWTVVANSLAASQSGSYTLSLACPSTTVAPRRRAVVH